jgi:hypothetical protein
LTGKIQLLDAQLNTKRIVTLGLERTLSRRQKRSSLSGEKRAAQPRNSPSCRDLNTPLYKDVPLLSLTRAVLASLTLSQEGDLFFEPVSPTHAHLPVVQSEKAAERWVSARGGGGEL